MHRRSLATELTLAAACQGPPSPAKRSQPAAAAGQSPAPMSHG